MMVRSRFSIFALQQRLSRPGTTIVFAVFTLGYLLYLTILLSITLQEGDVKEIIPQWGDQVVDYEWYENVLIKVSYPFNFYFSNNYGSDYYGYSMLPNSVKPFVIRSETIFLISLFTMVLVLTLAHVKARKGRYIINRLPLSLRSVYAMQWLSDFVHVLCLWLSHLAVIFIFYMIYMYKAPAEFTYPQNLYTLFADEQYLYLLFPILNPISFARMFTLMFAVSVLPASLASFFEDISILLSPQHERWFDLGRAYMTMALIGLILWAYYESGHLSSITVCSIAMVVGVIVYCMEGFPSKSRTAIKTPLFVNKPESVCVESPNSDSTIAVELPKGVE